MYLKIIPQYRFDLSDPMVKNEFNRIFNRIFNIQ